MSPDPLESLLKVRQLHVAAAQLSLMERVAQVQSIQADLESCGKALAIEASTGDGTDFARWLPAATAKLAALERSRAEADLLAAEASDALTRARADLEALEQMLRLKRVERARQQRRAEQRRLDEAAIRAAAARPSDG